MRFRLVLVFLLCTGPAGCGDAWNDPYPAAASGRNFLYTAFTERPKHLDPVQSYSENEATFIQQIYEPPLQYHYLKRPYQLIPLAAERVPQPRHYDAADNEVAADAREVRYSVYEIRIRRGVMYQPHPAFARDAAGKPRYHALGREDLAKVSKISDFEETGTRELIAEDYVYQIKRLAHPRLHSPILHFMFTHIAGLKEFADTLKAADQARAGRGEKEAWIDMTQFPLAGVQLVDRYTYRIRVEGNYPQFVYWLAMPFFAPMPAEVDRFFAQPGMADRNLTLDWWPVGTGPYMMTENNPNSRMVLERNPNFHGETYPAEGEAGDAERGLLADAGRPIPFIDKIVFSREKEAIPYWNKFLQGYYDTSGIASDSFDQAVRVSVEGETAVSPDMAAKGIRLEASVQTSTAYYGFNWLDPVVGGNSARARKLRQAVSIAVDIEEFISIFENGRALAAMGPIPPGIFGFRDGKDGINPVVYEWADDRVRRKPIETAKRLLAEAGYPEGFALTLHGPNDRYVNDDQICQAIAQMLSRIGIQTRLETMPSSVYFSRGTRLEFSARALRSRGPSPWRPSGDPGGLPPASGRAPSASRR